MSTRPAEAPPSQPGTVEFSIFHLFCGIGGGALGFQQARAEWQGVRGRFRTLGGVDVDHDACADFAALTGVQARCLDLFSRADYTAFHGHEPPPGWREATGADLRAASGGVRPDVVFTSPPCKGFSSLLPRVRSESAKYQALNRLTVRGLALALEAWRDDPPGLILFENVARISTRGQGLLLRIRSLLRANGYEVAEGCRDVGETGGLAQHRTRYLLIARHPAKVPAFVYAPPKLRVRSVGEVLGPLPLPDDPAGGSMHRLPRLQWLTWVRLALIPAGGDWRDLQGVGPGSFAIRPAGCPHFNHVAKVTEWTEPAGAVTGAGGPWQGAASVADPRLPGQHWPGQFRIVRWDEPARTVTGQGASLGSNAGLVVADPRLGHSPRNGSFSVASWQEPAGTVIGAASVRGSNGVAAVADPRIASSVADPRLPDAEGRHTAKFHVVSWDGASGTVTGSDRVGSGAPCVGDPRLGCACRSGAYGVLRWEKPACTVTAAGDIHAQGASAVADPRLPGDREPGSWVIVAQDGTWHRPLTTLELAILQGFPSSMPDGRPLQLAGRSQARWRERIGNAVPPPAAKSIGDLLLLALLPSTSLTDAPGSPIGAGAIFGTAIWVRRTVARALRRRPERTVSA